MAKKRFDFAGWATRNDLLCSDGRTIKKNAFKHNDGQTVPLVWNHQHNEPYNVLGHALLENRDDGVYAHCTFNDGQTGQHAKLLVQHGDVTALSIRANKLQQLGGDVIHGLIQEVSLVLAGANPGAFIETVALAHSEAGDEEIILYTGEALVHSDDNEQEEDLTMPEKPAPDVTHADDSETVGDVFNTLTEKQKKVVYAMIATALESEAVQHNDTDEGDGELMHTNVFEKQGAPEEQQTLSHAEMSTIFADAKRLGSLKASVLEHGIDDIEFLFPDAKNAVPGAPIVISRRMEWVADVMKGVRNSPFSRIKSIMANLTEDEARAKGYITGNMKKEQFFGLIKRTTTPQTVYKKQQLDRDDVVDITDFDVIMWLKGEMRTMLDEELARAFLVGDDRPTSSDDKINPINIRPIWQDDDLFTIKQLSEAPATSTSGEKARAFIISAIKSRKHYKGSGNPTMYMTEDMLTSCLLIEDLNQRVIYDSVEKLATALRVSKIVTVPIMENLKRTTDDGDVQLDGIIVNLSDYNVGADKGGAINLFDDFDIDYNQMKYLIETRCSGALIRPYSAIALESKLA